MKKYRVVEQHYGDKQYWPGDERELRDDDAAELLKYGLIVEAGEDLSAESDKKMSAGKKAPNTKDLKDAPKNKAAEVPSETVDKTDKEPSETGEQAGNHADN